MKKKIYKEIKMFTFPLFCCTMILPVICVGVRFLKGLPRITLG